MLCVCLFTCGNYVCKWRGVVSIMHFCLLLRGNAHKARCVGGHEFYSRQSKSYEYAGDLSLTSVIIEISGERPLCVTGVGSTALIFTCLLVWAASVCLLFTLSPLTEALF